MNKWMSLSIATLSMTGAFNPAVAASNETVKNNVDTIKQQNGRKFEATGFTVARKLKDRNIDLAKPVPPTV